MTRKTFRIFIALTSLLLSMLAVAQEPKKEKDSEKTKTQKNSFTYATVNGEKVVVSGSGNHQSSAIFIGEDGKVQNVSSDGTHVWVSQDEIGSDELKSVVLLSATDGHEKGNSLIFEFSPKHGVLGVECVELTDELRAHFGAPADAGIMVGRVIPEGPAATAGFKVGDILTHLDGDPVVHSGQLLKVLMTRDPGDQVEAELWRDGAVLQAGVILGEADSKEVWNLDHAAKTDILVTEGKNNFQFKTFQDTFSPKVEYIFEEPTDLNKKIEALYKKIEALEQKINEQKENHEDH